MALSPFELFFLQPPRGARIMNENMAAIKALFFEVYTSLSFRFVLWPKNKKENVQGSRNFVLLASYIRNGNEKETKLVRYLQEQQQ